MKGKYSKEILERVRKIKHFALDMDGTIYTDGKLFECTNPMLQRLSDMGIGYSFLTNNPSRSSEEYMTMLVQIGIKATAEMLYTSAQATIEYLKEALPSVRRLFIMGTQSMISEFEQAGYDSLSIDEEPEAVVVGFDMSLTYPRLCCAAWWISQGKPYIATNPDRVCPTARPTVLVDCGSITAMIAHATARHPDITVGKPNPRMLQGLIRRLDCSSDQIAMVGDRIYTDIEMARGVGVLGILVLSGETTLEAAMNDEHTPELIVKDLGELEQLIVEAHSDLPR